MDVTKLSRFMCSFWGSFFCKKYLLVKSFDILQVWQGFGGGLSPCSCFVLIWIAGDVPKDIAG